MSKLLVVHWACPSPLSLWLFILYDFKYLMCNLLNKSHESLRDDYEVTGEYLDYIHDSTLQHGALVERMTGAGFGGSSIALIRKNDC